MNKITTIGLDLAKNVFHVVCCDARGKEIRKRKLKRSQVLGYFAQMPVCQVAMESCSGAHYFARELSAQGHTVKLIAAQHVKPYVRGQKNDYNDARAIAEASTRPGMRLVGMKTEAQQDLQALHRMRQRLLTDRTALCNQLRGFLAERGRVAPRGIKALRRCLVESLGGGANGPSELLRTILAAGYRRLQELDAHIEQFTEQVKRSGEDNEACQRLQTIPGYGPIVASVFHSVVGDGRGYRRGRDVSAALGVVPRQHSSGGKATLLGITKKGDKYLRSVMTHGARAVVTRAAGKDDPLSRWINDVRARRGMNKATIALVNKMARVGWAILAHDTVYQPRQDA